MKKLLSYALAVACLFAVPSMTLAKGKGAKPLAGKVTAVDAAANTITVKTKKEDKTFKAEGATITVDGASAKLADIKVGMKAEVTAGSGDTATAISATTHTKEKKAGKQGGKKGGTAPAPAATPAPEATPAS